MDANNLPLICFKCHYEMILMGKGGRHEAMKIYNFAQLEQLKIAKPSGNYERDLVLYPVKDLWIHQTSKEMNDLNLFKGTFYDYRN